MLKSFLFICFLGYEFLDRLLLAETGVCTLSTSELKARCLLRLRSGFWIGEPREICGRSSSSVTSEGRGLFRRWCFAYKGTFCSWRLRFSSARGIVEISLRLILRTSSCYSSNECRFFGAFFCKKVDTVVVGWRKKSPKVRLPNELSIFLGIFTGVGVKIDH